MIERITDIVRSIMPNKDTDLKPELDLIDSAGLDSVNMLELITSLEEHFSISFEDDDLDINNFRTIESIFNTISLHYGQQNNSAQSDQLSRPELKKLG